METTVLLGLLALAGCATTTSRRDLPPLETVPSVDLPRYVGTWYEIASFPQRFQEGCTGTSATYSLRADGKIEVVNRCRDEALDGPERVATGVARVADKRTNARLKVSFFRPFWGDYWIVQLDPEYRWAVVGHPSRDYLWILSRAPTLDDATYGRILERLTASGYDVARLRRTLQPGP